ncbi:hypothetical protein FHX45_001359 [Amycolatopsis granulosa]|nr:hypothetical protein [Amycolatopsis granulosa]
MAEFVATVLAKIGANLIESLILRLAQSLFASSFAPANA